MASSPSTPDADREYYLELSQLARDTPRFSVTDLVNEGHEVTFGKQSRIDTDDNRCVILRRHNKLFFMDYLPPLPSLFHGGGARQSALFGRSTLAAASSTLPRDRT